MRRSALASMLALALTLAAQPAAGQDARACANEVQRLSEAFPLTGASGQEKPAIAQQPGARAGASLGAEQQKQFGDLVSAARTAGEQGEGPLCVQRLTEARALLRQAGVGSGQPGTVPIGSGTGTARTTPRDAGTGATTTAPAGGGAGTDAGAGGATGLGTRGTTGTVGGPSRPATDLPAGRGSTDGSVGGTSGGATGGASGGSTGGGLSGSGGGGR